MRARRVYRANQKTGEQRSRERSIREQLQQWKPSLEDLIREGDCDPHAIITMGRYFELAAKRIRRERSGPGG